MEWLIQQLKELGVYNHITITVDNKWIQIEMCKRKIEENTKHPVYIFPWLFQAWFSHVLRNRWVSGSPQWHATRNNIKPINKKIDEWN